MLKKFSQFLNDESGATAIEYGLIASLIAVVIIGAVTACRHQPLHARSPRLLDAL